MDFFGMADGSKAPGSVAEGRSEVGSAKTRGIIVDPDTAEILRDLWLDAEGKLRLAHLDYDDANDSDAREDGGDGDQQ